MASKFILGSATDAPDATFYVSGSIGKKDVAGTAVFGGDVVISGSLYVAPPRGTSGSPVLVVDEVNDRIGVNITAPLYDLHVNGAGATVVTIDAGASSDGFVRFATNTTLKSYIKLGSGGNFIIANDATAGDILLKAKPDGVVTEYLTLDASAAAPALVVNEDGVDVDFRVESADKKEALLVNALTSQVLILSGTNRKNSGGTSFNESLYTDMAFFVSGSIGCKDSPTHSGSAVFGGDVVVSGAFYLEELPITPGVIADGTVALYGKDDSGVTKLYFKNESGETEIGAGGGGGRSVAGTTDNGIITWVNSDSTFASEVNFIFDGTDGRIKGVGKLEFGNANTYINSPSADFLDIVSSTALFLSGATTTVINDLPDWTVGVPAAGVGGGLSLRQLGTGTGMTAGAVYYLSGSGTWTAAQASHVESGSMNFMAVAGSALIEGDMFVNGPVNVAAAQFDGGIPTLSGSAVYLSKNTAGSFTATAPTGSGEIVKVLGHCIGIDSAQALVWFNPDRGWIELS